MTKYFYNNMNEPSTNKFPLELVQSWGIFIDYNLKNILDQNEWTRKNHHRLNAEAEALNNLEEEAKKRNDAYLAEEKEKNKANPPPTGSMSVMSLSGICVYRTTYQKIYEDYKERYTYKNPDLHIPCQLSLQVGKAFFSWYASTQTINLDLEGEYHEVSSIGEFITLCEIFDKEKKLPKFYN